MSAEQAFAAVGRQVDWFFDKFMGAVTEAFNAVKRAEDTIWRASHAGEAAEAVGEYAAYRSAVMAVHQAATTETRVEMNYALARGRRQASIETSLAILRMHQRFLVNDPSCEPVLTDTQWAALHQPEGGS